GMDPAWTFERFAAEAIQRTLPRGSSEHYDRMWEFVRLVASHPQYGKQSVATLRRIVGEWHERALPYIARKDLNETWRLFRSGMRDLKYPAGCGLRDAMK